MTDVAPVTTESTALSTESTVTTSTSTGNGVNAPVVPLSKPAESVLQRLRMAQTSTSSASKTITEPASTAAESSQKSDSGESIKPTQFSPVVSQPVAVAQSSVSSNHEALSVTAKSSEKPESQVLSESFSRLHFGFRDCLFSVYLDGHIYHTEGTSIFVSANKTTDAREIFIEF